MAHPLTQENGIRCGFGDAITAKQPRIPRISLNLDVGVLTFSEIREIRGRFLFSEQSLMGFMAHPETHENGMGQQVKAFNPKPETLNREPIFGTGIAAKRGGRIHTFW